MWHPSHEAHAARMRSEAEPPMRRMRKRRHDTKYAALDADVSLQLTRLTSTLDPDATFTVFYGRHTSIPR
jgi:hypothetical protein